MGTIYLMTTDYESTYKIGITTKTADQRKRSLQTGNADKIDIVKTYETKNHKLMEKWLHRKFQTKRLEGEWFNLDETDVLGFLDTCKQIDNSLNLLVKENHYLKK